MSSEQQSSGRRRRKRNKKKGRIQRRTSYGHILHDDKEEEGELTTRTTATSSSASSQRGPARPRPTACQVTATVSLVMLTGIAHIVLCAIGADLLLRNNAGFLRSSFARGWWCPLPAGGIVVSALALALLPSPHPATAGAVRAHARVWEKPHKASSRSAIVQALGTSLVALFYWLYFSDMLYWSLFRINMLGKVLESAGIFLFVTIPLLPPVAEALRGAQHDSSSGTVSFVVSVLQDVAHLAMKHFVLLIGYRRFFNAPTRIQVQCIHLLLIVLAAGASLNAMLRTLQYYARPRSSLGWALRRVVAPVASTLPDVAALAAVASVWRALAHPYAALAATGGLVMEVIAPVVWANDVDSLRRPAAAVSAKASSSSSAAAAAAATTQQADTASATPKASDVAATSSSASSAPRRGRQHRTRGSKGASKSSNSSNSSNGSNGNASTSTSTPSSTTAKATTARRRRKRADSGIADGAQLQPAPVTSAPAAPAADNSVAAAVLFAGYQVALLVIMNVTRSNTLQ